MKHLNIYRDVCITYLLSREEYFNEDTDYYIDLALRQVSGLPMKPEGHDEYNGLVGMKPVDEQRVQCLRLIKQRLVQKDVQTADLSLDKAVRKLNNLPSRPAGNEPYSGLFNINKEVKPVNEFAPASQFKTSKVGLDLIHSFESYRECTYKDPGSRNGLPITG